MCDQEGWRINGQTRNYDQNIWNGYATNSSVNFKKLTEVHTSFKE